MTTLNSKVKAQLKRTASEQIDYIEELVNKYPIITIRRCNGRKRLGRMERTY